MHAPARFVRPERVGTPGQKSPNPLSARASTPGPRRTGTGGSQGGRPPEAGCRNSVSTILLQRRVRAERAQPFFMVIVSSSCSHVRVLLDENTREGSTGQGR